MVSDSQTTPSAQEALETWAKDWVWLRFGRLHDKPCKRPSILTCAMWECQKANECTWDEARGKRIVSSVA